MQRLICLLRPLMLDAETFQLLFRCTMIHLSLFSLTRREFCALNTARCRTIIASWRRVECFIALRNRFHLIRETLTFYVLTFRLSKRLKIGPKNMALVTVYLSYRTFTYSNVLFITKLWVKGGNLKTL